MDKHFKVEFSSPDTTVTFDDVYSLSICSIEGELVILPGHSPFIIYLIPSLTSLKTSEEKEEKIMISDAVLKITNNYCIVMTDRLEKKDADIDQNKKKASVQHYLDFLNMLLYAKRESGIES